MTEKLAAFIRSIAADRDDRVSPGLKAEAEKLIAEYDATELVIIVDKLPHCARRKMTGIDIRQVSVSRNDYDLYREVRGGGDVKVADLDVLEIQGDERFYTAPREING